MAGNLGSLVVSLGLDAAEFVQALTKSEYETRKAMNAIRKDIQDVQAGFSRAAGVLATISGGALTFAGVIAGFQELKHVTIESEQSILQLNAALKATQGAAGFTAGDLAELGRGVRAATTFSTEDITKAETALLRFRDVRKEVFEEALTQIPNLAIALGLSLPEAAAKLGRALEDPLKGLRGLREAGVFLTESQTALSLHFSELGEKAKSQRIILDAVAASTSGAATAATLGLSGATDKLARSFKELEIAAGKQLFGDTHKGLETLTDLFEKLTKKIDDGSVSFTKWATVAASSLAGPIGLITSLGVVAGNKIADLFKGDESKVPKDFRGQSPADSEQELASSKVAKAISDAAENARRLDSLNIQSFELLKNLAGRSAQIYAGDAAIKKYYLDKSVADLEFSYQQGTVSTDVYYAGLKAAALKSFNDQEQVNARRIQAEEAVIRSNLSTLADRDAARGRILGIINQGTTARIAKDERIEALARQEIVAIQKLRDEYADLGATVAEAQGRIAEAAVARFDLANKDKRKRFEGEASSLDPVTSALGRFGLDAQNLQRSRIDAQNKLTEATQKYAITLGDVGIEQARVDLLQQTGALSEIGAINAKADIARKYIGILSAEADERERIAKTLQGPERDAALLEIRKLRLEIDQLSASTDVLAGKFRDIFTGGFSTFLTDLISGTKTAKQAFLDMAKSIEQSISQIASKNISEALFGKSGPLGGISESFAKLFGGGAKVVKDVTVAAGTEAADAALTTLGATAATVDVSFGTLDATSLTVDASFASLAVSAATASVALDAIAASSAASAGASSIGSLGSLIASIVPAAAFGTPFVKRTGLAMIHEGERIIPASENRGGNVIPFRGGITTTNNVTVNVLPGATRASADQAATAIALELRRAQARTQ